MHLALRGCSCGGDKVGHCTRWTFRPGPSTTAFCLRSCHARFVLLFIVLISRLAHTRKCSHFWLNKVGSHSRLNPRHISRGALWEGSCSAQEEGHPGPTSECGARAFAFVRLKEKMVKRELQECEGDLEQLNAGMLIWYCLYVNTLSVNTFFGALMGINGSMIRSIILAKKVHIKRSTYQEECSL